LNPGIERLLEEGAALFDRGQFFEAHEVWEDAWRVSEGQEKLLLHGLIQVAASLHKQQCGQPGGAASLLSKAQAKLSAFRGNARGFDPRALLESISSGRTIPPLSKPRRLFSAAIHSHIEIEATAWKVWETLTDFAAYPEWNPFIVRIEGAIRTGARLRVEIRPPGRRPMTFRPRLLRVDEDRELRWLGHLLFPGVLDGEHVLGIAPLTPGRVRFSQRETFRGGLVPVLGRSLLEPTVRGFEEMNLALKRRVERAQRD
jgi:hypothetical protein